MPPSTWYRFVAGLNVRLRLVRKGFLKMKFRQVIEWLETFANPTLRIYGVHVDLALFQTTVIGYCQYGLVIYSVEETQHVLLAYPDESSRDGQHSRYKCLYWSILAHMLFFVFARNPFGGKGYTKCI